MVGTRLLGPILTVVVHPRGLAFELAAHRPLQHVGVDEGIAVAVGHGPRGRWERHDRRGEGLSRNVRKRLFEEGCQGLGRVCRLCRSNAGLGPCPRCATDGGGRQRGDQQAVGDTCCVHELSPVRSVATRLIVLPRGRRWRAKASAVSARGRTSPTSGFNRPSRTRWASSVSCARSGSTTKKTARPSFGCAVGGTAMVTSVPPRRTSARSEER